MSPIVPYAARFAADSLDQVARDLEAERLQRPKRITRRGTPHPLTPQQQRANFLALAAALGGLQAPDWEWLEANPVEGETP